MRLIYWKEKPNFGDALNPWLWDKIFPNFFDEDSSVAVLGIGTLINDWATTGLEASFKIVLGSGVGYYTQLPKINENWRVYFLRGPLSAKLLGLDPKLALVDPAVLVKNMFPYVSAPKKYRFSYIPHWEASGWAWKTVCENVGVNFIDPFAPVEHVLNEIASSEVIIAEAMHGAIVADALRVPWIATSSSKHILAFKWRDYCESLNLTYRPAKLPSLRHVKAQGHVLSRALGRLKIDRATKALGNLVQEARVELSNEKILNDLTSRVEERLEHFRNDANELRTRKKP